MSMSKQIRTCIECDQPLLAEAPDSRRYCGMQCRRRAGRRRERRAGRETEVARLQRLLNESRMRENRLESRLAAAREQVETTRTQRRREAVNDQKSQRYAQRAIIDRVGRLLDTRDRLAAVSADLEAAKADPSNRTDLQIAAQQIVDLQKSLAAITDRYNDLSGQHSQLRDRYAGLVSDYNKAADRLNDAARDRQRFRPVIDAWDELAGRLARSAKTTALSAGDREIVRMWASWQAGRDRRRKAGH